MEDPSAFTAEVNTAEVNTAEIIVRQAWWTVLGAIVAIAFVASGVWAGIYYWQHSDPYVQKVLSIRGEMNRGHSIFQLNCAGCHGVMADGRVGPSLHGVSSRRSEWSLIQQITSGQTPPMPKFQATPKEMADLLSYLKTL